MIQFQVLGGDTLAFTLRQYAPKIQSALESSIGKATLRLQGYVMANKLSGQVLNVRTGNLRRHIDQFVNVSDKQITGLVGTNVRYGVAHEYGFSGTVTVKAHMRLIKQAFGKPLKQPRYVQVKAYSMNVKLPERSFLRSALRDLQPQIEANIQQAIQGAIE